MICNTVRSTLLRRMIGLQITSKSFTQSRNVINFIKTNLNRSQIKLSYCDRAKSNIIKMTDDNLPTNSLTNDCNTGKDGNATIQSCLDCPECVIGMQTIDRDSFNKKITIPTITVKRKDINLLVKMLKKYLFKVTFIKPIVQQEDGSTLIRLNPDIIDTSESGRLNPTIAELLQKEQLQLTCQEITLTYENYSAATIFKQVLKYEPEQFSSFSVVGHLLHLNLKPTLDRYKALIGQVLLDKNPNVQAVINKLDAIDSTFRYFAFETLAARYEPVDTMVKVRESGCTFRFDFAKVYWNPRLGTEHERIVKLLRPGRDVLYDVFAGVGPFAVPVARSGCKVLANDLNPASFEALQDNAKLNKGDSLRAFNLDGREFIRKVIRDDLAHEWKKRSGHFEMQGSEFHVLMNLPAIAIEFLSSFVGLFNDLYSSDAEFRDVYDADSITLPVVHCYAFYKGIEDANSVVQRRAADYLEWPDTENLSELKVRFVRTVAPNKSMLCVTFKLPKNVLVTTNTGNPNKRVRRQ